MTPLKYGPSKPGAAVTWGLLSSVTARETQGKRDRPPRPSSQEPSPDPWERRLGPLPSSRLSSTAPTLAGWGLGSGWGWGRWPFLPGACRATLLTHAGTGSWRVRLCLHMFGSVML